MAFVYRFIDDKERVIYYGKTIDLDSRIHNHFTRGHLPRECYDSVARIEYQKYKTESDALIMETYYITKYNPKYNKLGKSRDIPDIEFEEKKWKTYRVFDVKPSKSNRNFNIFTFISAIIYILLILFYLFLK